jgi:polyphosphate kinase
VPKKFEKLGVSPITLRQTLTGLIDQEIKNAREGKRAQIWAKCNALVDRAIIDKLYEASAAGVEIELVVRGVCALRPQAPGLSENIHVKSIVGRFLEHSRIYCFANGEDMPSGHGKVFISSADLMHRNLDNRIETLVPITNQTVHRQILEQIMIASLKDQRNSWLMQPDGAYIQAERGENPFDAHEYFMQNPSLSGRGKALQAVPAVARLNLEKRKRKQVPPAQ